MLLAEMLFMEDNQAKHPFMEEKGKEAVKVIYDIDE